MTGANESGRDRGSVLMEFIVVFPIYLVLFGGVFMVGDMLVHATRLASAERVAAFDLQTGTGPSVGWTAMQDKLFHVFARGTEAGRQREIADDGSSQDRLRQVGADGYDRWDSYQYADTEVDCPWSLQAAMKICDDYKLPVGGTAGRLLFADEFFGGSGPSSDGDSGLHGLFGGAKRTAMYSKSLYLRDSASGRYGQRTYTYNYYTLKRTKYERGEGRLTWRDNARPSSDLVVRTSGGVPSPGGEPHAWESQVGVEEWHKSVYPEPRVNRHPRGLPCGGMVEYGRYGVFVDMCR